MLTVEEKSEIAQSVALAGSDGSVALAMSQQHPSPSSSDASSSAKKMVLFWHFFPSFFRANEVA